MKILVRFSCKILLLINASTVSTRANESWDQDNTSKERRWQYTVSHILGATLGNPKIMVRGALAAQQHGQFIA